MFAWRALYNLTSKTGQEGLNIKYNISERCPSDLMVWNETFNMSNVEKYSQISQHIKFYWYLFFFYRFLHKMCILQPIVFVKLLFSGVEKKNKWWLFVIKENELSVCLFKLPHAKQCRPFGISVNEKKKKNPRVVRGLRAIRQPPVVRRPHSPFLGLWGGGALLNV